MAASWRVQVPTWQQKTMLTTSTWGTSRADAFTLFEKSLNQQRHKVYDLGPDGERIFNPEQTLLAAEKQQALSDRFAAWVWEDPARAHRLAGRYNELFNSIVLPTWDGVAPDLPRPVPPVQAPSPPGRRGVAGGAGTISAIGPRRRRRQDRHSLSTKGLSRPSDQGCCVVRTCASRLESQRSQSSGNGHRILRSGLLPQSHRPSFCSLRQLDMA